MLNRFMKRKQRKLPIAGNNIDGPATPNVSLFSRVVSVASKAVSVSPQEPTNQEETDMAMDDDSEQTILSEPSSPGSSSSSESEEEAMLTISDMTGNLWRQTKKNQVGGNGISGNISTNQRTQNSPQLYDVVRRGTMNRLLLLVVVLVAMCAPTWAFTMPRSAVSQPHHHVRWAEPPQKDETTAAPTSGTYYDDEVEPAPKVGISDSMKERLMKEASRGLDSEQKQDNVLLYIIAAVGVLVILGGQGIFY